MSDDTTLDEIKTFAAALSPWAHLATVGPDGAPDVVPVHPGWEGDTDRALVLYRYGMAGSKRWRA